MRERVLIAAVAGLLATGPAAAERIAATYEVTLSGLPIGRFEAGLQADAASYRLSYSARTAGLVGVLFPFRSAGASEGVLSGLGPAPLRYAGESSRRDGTSSWAVEFDRDGLVERVDVTVPEDEVREPVPPALQKAPEPLALALRVTADAAPGIRLEDTSFDGKRAVRFTLACDPAGRLAANAPGTPADGTLHCTVDGELAAGGVRRWQDGRSGDRSPARVQLSPDIVPGRYWPVRVEAETRWGTVIARLTEVR